MPTQLSLQSAEHALRQEAEVPDLHVAVLDVILDPPREDVIDRGDHVRESVSLEHLLQFVRRVRVRDRAPELRLGVLRDELPPAPETPPALAEDDPQDLPAPPVVDHQLDGSTRLQ